MVRAAQCWAAANTNFALTTGDCNRVERDSSHITPLESGAVIMFTRSRETKSRADDSGDKPTILSCFDPPSCRVLRRARFAHHRLAGLGRGAEWLRSGPACWVGRVAHHDTLLSTAPYWRSRRAPEWRRPRPTIVKSGFPGSRIAEGHNKQGTWRSSSVAASDPMDAGENEGRAEARRAERRDAQGRVRPLQRGRDAVVNRRELCRASRCPHGRNR
jgi:hypothetical protein